MNPYWQSLAAPWRQRANDQNQIFLIVLVTLLFLLGAVVLFSQEFSQMSMLLSVLILVMMVTHVLWMLHISATMQLNQPACVLLVPRYLLVQRRALLALWLALALLQTLALVGTRALGLTHLVDSPALWLLACGGGLLCWVLMTRWGVASAFVWLLIAFSPRLFTEAVGDRSLPLPTMSDAAYYANWYAAPALAAMAWVLSRSALRSGNAAHRAQASRSANLASVMDGQNPAHVYRLSTRVRKLLSFLETPFQHYARWLLTRLGNGPHNALARAELGLGANTHWVMQVVNASATFAVLALVALCAGLIWGNTLGMLTSLIPLLILGFIAFAPLETRRIALRFTVKEQSLMLLLPGMPQGVDLNRALAKRHLVQSLGSWLAMTVVVLCVPWSERALPLAWALSLLTLPILPVVIQDWSRVTQLTLWQGLNLVLRDVLLMPVALVALYFLDVPVPWLVVVSGTFFVVSAAWRWKRLAGFAQAFPVGHRVNFSQ